MVEQMRFGEEMVEVVVVTSMYHMPRSAWMFRVVAAAVGAECQFVEQVVEGEERDVEALAKEERLMKVMPSWVKEAMKKWGVEVEELESIEAPVAEIRKMLQGHI